MDDQQAAAQPAATSTARRPPALVTGGRYDEARPAHLAVLARGLRDAELVIFENSSHMAFIEEREAYIRVVEDFLGRVEAGAAGEA